MTEKILTPEGEEEEVNEETEEETEEVKETNEYRTNFPVE